MSYGKKACERSNVLARLGKFLQDAHRGRVFPQAAAGHLFGTKEEFLFWEAAR